MHTQGSEPKRQMRRGRGLYFVKKELYDPARQTLVLAFIVLERDVFIPDGIYITIPTTLTLPDENYIMIPAVAVAGNKKSTIHFRWLC